MAEYTISENATSTNEQQQPSTKGTGYINSTYYTNQQTEAKNLEAASNTDAAMVEQLQQKLGVNLNEEPQQPVESDPQTVQDEFVQRLSTPEGQRLAKDFKENLGIDLNEAFGIIQNTAQLTKELEGWRQQVLRERQVEELRKEWGNDYDAIFPQVVEEFKKLPPQMQQALDNPDGARLLAAQIRQRSRTNSRSSHYIPNSNVRAMGDRNQSPTIRMSEMVNWSGAELDRRIADVQRAKANGTFIYDL